MIVYPAIDIRGGQCVRLSQGDYARETVYNPDPVAQAREWVRRGAEWIHVVDLDGARDGLPVNRDLVARLVQDCHVPVQLGGGIRTPELAAGYIDAGVSRIVLGSLLVREPDKAFEIIRNFPGKVAAGIDARDGMAAVQGWTELTGVSALDLARKALEAGATHVIYTDISRDGMLEGPNLEQTSRLAADTGRVIASGGVARLDDIRALSEIAGVEGVIVGRALYESKFTLEDAIDVAG
ncbi:MAG: 1-(5-phosphoribosyl)-5-[(5-phosphoribosylamino)methylideneamino]imidazole-4-carboxamide isomerase [Deltaproteobacteria bacterium]|nr:1-(5-phosphoribosyl)-5-[(5-phosphoribosylamino)methylideneamino]imidazole-4-carboxamide isomerase [Deltaproteobacteria bacterium]